MKKIFVTLSVVALMMGACNNANKAKEVAEQSMENAEMIANEAIDKVENAFRVEGFEGSYEGILPCADCEGIKTTLKLNSGDTYELTQEYLGKKDVLKDTYKGKFSWAMGGVITLEGIKDMSALFKVEKDKVLFLDVEGNVINGELAENYILKKK